MKNITKIIALIAVVALSAFSTSVQAQKVAYIDSDAIIVEMPAYKRAKSEVEAYGKQLQKQLEGKQKEMQDYYAEVAQKIEVGGMTRNQEAEAKAKLEKMQLDLQKQAQEADQKLLAKEQELTKPMYEELDAAIKKVAKENSYGYVVDKKFLLYVGGGIDATEKVKTTLGISW